MMRLLSALLAPGVLLGGCEPSCKQACEKLLDCEEVSSPRVSLEDCQYTCETEQALYEESWEDLQKREALADAKRCILDETCSAIASGACYDPDLYVW